jgi:hypothetical protein
MRVALRKDDDVALLNANGGFTRDSSPTSARHDEMIFEEMFDTRHDNWNVILHGCRLSRPRSLDIDMEERRTGQPDGTQDV